MGLDMYAYKRTYIGNDYAEKDKQVQIVVPEENRYGKLIKQERVSSVSEKIAYWRKANQIHKWFVENVQNGVDDCGTYDVSRDQLQALVDLCKVVLAASRLVDGKVKNGGHWEAGGWVAVMEDGKTIEDAKIAAALLPTESGFFFGGTDYDEYYYQDLKDTVEQLEPELLADPYGDYEYHSSW